MTPIELRWTLPCKCPSCGYEFDMVEWCEDQCHDDAAQYMWEHHGTEFVMVCPECEREIEFITR